MTCKPAYFEGCFARAHLHKLPAFIRDLGLGEPDPGNMKAQPLQQLTILAFRE